MPSSPTQGGAACGITADALCGELRLRPGQRHPRLDLRPARRGFGRRRRASSCCSTSAPLPSLATASPTRAWSMCRQLLRAARLPRPYRAAWLRAVARGGGRRLRQGQSATPRSPTPIGSSSCSRRRRRARDQPEGLLGLVGLYRPRLSRQGRAADQSDLGHGRAARRKHREGEDAMRARTASWWSRRRSAPSSTARPWRCARRSCGAPLGLTISAEELADDARRQHFCAPRSARWWARCRSSRSTRDALQLKQMAVAEERRRERRRRAASLAMPKTGRADQASAMVLNAGLAPRASMRGLRLPGRRRAVRREHLPRISE